MFEAAPTNSPVLRMMARAAEVRAEVTTLPLRSIADFELG
jgi:hypothetical protein